MKEKTADKIKIELKDIVKLQHLHIDGVKIDFGHESVEML